MRALRTSKIWLLLTLHALLILAGAPAFASPCCAAAPAKTQNTSATCHDEAATKAKTAPIVRDCCSPDAVGKSYISAAHHAFSHAHLQRVCSCPNSEIVAAVNDDARCAHQISHAVATLPNSSAPRLQAACFLFFVASFLAPPALDNRRASGCSSPLV